MSLPQLTLSFMYISAVVKPFGSSLMCLSIIAPVKGTLLCTLAHFAQRHTHARLLSHCLHFGGSAATNQRPG